MNQYTVVTARRLVTSRTKEIIENPMLIIDSQNIVSLASSFEFRYDKENTYISLPMLTLVMKDFVDTQTELNGVRSNVFGYDIKERQNTEFEHLIPQFVMIDGVVILRS